MEKKLNKIKYKQITLFAVILFLFMTFEGFVYLFLNIEEITASNYFIIAGIKYFIIILFFLIYYRKYLKEKWIDFKKNFNKYVKISFKDWFTGFIIMYISNFFIMRIIGDVGQNEQSVQALISYTPIIAFIMTTILAPITEEMIFRKMLGDCFNEPILFMIISGFIFGLVHVLGADNLLEHLLIIPYGSLGFMFAHTLSKTDNIYCTIMVHAFHNGILTLLSIMVNL